MGIVWGILVSLGSLVFGWAFTRRGRHLVREAENRADVMTAIVEQSPVAVGITDISGNIEYINPAFEKTSGYSLQEALGKNPSLLKAGVTPEEVYVELWNTITSGNIWTGELCNKRKDGNLYWEQAYIAPLQNRQGETTHFLKIAEEISEKKKARAALANSEKRFRSFFERASVGMALVDRQGCWQKVNAKLCRIVGYSPEELIGHSFLAITPEKDREKEADWATAFESGEFATADIEKQYVHKDGHLIWVDLSATLVRDEIGAPQYYLIMIKDITRLRLAEQDASRRQNQLAHLDRIHTLQQMSSELAHEIDQPLCAILAASQASLRIIGNKKCDPSPDLLEALEIVATQAERAGRVVDGIRKFSRVQAPENKLLDLNQIIQEACELIDAELRSQGVKLELNLEKQTTLRVSCNPVQIEQVIVNLCRNGIEAMVENGSPTKTLKITRKNEGNSAKVSVMNTGSPIEAELAEKIFSPFFTTRKSGLGLGLSLSRSIIETSGGQLWTEPDLKQGVVFQFTIPLHEGE